MGTPDAQGPVIPRVQRVSCTYKPAKSVWQRQVVGIASSSLEISLQLRDPRDGVARVPSSLREVDGTGEGRRLEAEERTQASATVAARSGVSQP